MHEHQTKFEVFLELTNMLNCIGSVPIFYGSLALSQLLKESIEVDDIDILIEDRLFSTRLSEIHELMRSKGFILIDPEENEFERNNCKVGIASDGDFERFSGTGRCKRTRHSRTVESIVLGGSQRGNRSRNSWK